MTRIGILADTHCPEFLDDLPADLFAALGSCDLLIHAGDVGGAATLARLAELAPVHAVRGDHDPNLTQLPAVLTLDVDGRRIAVVHGNRGHWYEEPLTLLGTLSLGLVWPSPGLHRWLRRRFPDADVIVYGHTHRAVAADVDGALVINPGAVYQVTRTAAMDRLARHPGWFEWSWLQVIRHRRSVPAPSVAILEVGPRALVASFRKLG